MILYLPVCFAPVQYSVRIPFQKCPSRCSLKCRQQSLSGGEYSVCAFWILITVRDLNALVTCEGEKSRASTSFPTTVIILQVAKFTVPLRTTGATYSAYLIPGVAHSIARTDIRSARWSGCLPDVIVQLVDPRS